MPTLAIFQLYRGVQTVKGNPITRMLHADVIALWRKSVKIPKG